MMKTQETSNVKNQVVFFFKHLWVIVLLTALSVVLAAFVTVTMIPKTYFSHARGYITKADMVLQYVSVNELDFLNMLLLDMQQMAISGAFYQKLVDKTGVDISYEAYAKGLKFEIAPKSRFFQVGFISESSEQSYLIALSISDVLPNETKDFLKIPDIEIIDPPFQNRTPYAPSLIKNIALGGVAGLMSGVLVVLLAFLLGKTIRFPSELSAAGITVLVKQRRWKRIYREAQLNAIRNPLDADPYLEKLMIIHAALNKGRPSDQPYRLMVYSADESESQCTLAARVASFMVNEGYATVLLDLGDNADWFRHVFSGSKPVAKNGVPVCRFVSTGEDLMKYKDEQRKRLEGLLSFEDRLPDRVVINCGPLTSAHASFGLQGLADEALLVVTADTSTMDEVLMKQTLLEKHGIKTVGAVFVDSIG